MYEFPSLQVGADLVRFRGLRLQANLVDFQYGINCSALYALKFVIWTPMFLTDLRKSAVKTEQKASCWLYRDIIGLEGTWTIYSYWPGPPKSWIFTLQAKCMPTSKHHTACSVKSLASCRRTVAMRHAQPPEAPLQKVLRKM